jgi:hypothetical protein
VQKRRTGYRGVSASCKRRAVTRGRVGRALRWSPSIQREPPTGKAATSLRRGSLSNRCLPSQLSCRRSGRQSGITEPGPTLPPLPVRNARGLVRPSRRRAEAHKDRRCDRRPESHRAKPPIREVSCLRVPYPAHEALSPGLKATASGGHGRWPSGGASCRALA